MSPSAIQLPSFLKFNHKRSTLNLAVELQNRNIGISTYIPSQLLAKAAYSQNKTFYLQQFSYIRNTLRKKLFFAKQVDIYTRMQNGSAQHVLESTDELPHHKPATKQIRKTMSNRNQLFLVACGLHTMLVVLEEKPANRNDVSDVTWYDPSHCVKKHREYEGNIEALLTTSFPRTTFESFTKISAFINQGILNDCALLAAFAGCMVLKSRATDVLKKSEAAVHHVILGTKRRTTCVSDSPQSSGNWFQEWSQVSSEIFSVWNLKLLLWNWIWFSENVYSTKQQPVGVLDSVSSDSNLMEV